MTVEYNSKTSFVIASDVVNGNNEAVDALVRAALVTIAESSVDMVLDCQSDYETRKDVQASFDGLRDMTEDYLSDMMDGLKVAVICRLKEIKFSTKVRGLEYDDEGLADVRVELEFDE